MFVGSDLQPHVVVHFTRMRMMMRFALWVGPQRNIQGGKRTGGHDMSRSDEEQICHFISLIQDEEVRGM